MKKIVITLSLLILIIGLSLWFLYSKKNLKIEENNIFEYELIKEIIPNEIEEEEKDENIETNINDSDNNNKDDISNIYDTNKDDLESNNISNSNVIKKENKKSEQVIEKQKETTIDTTIHETKDGEKKVEETTKIIEEVRDDIVDTNSWFYSIHHGKIDTYSQEKCLFAGNEIAFIDTVDINYYRCYEVTSTTGKVLGYYLNIFCNSDNCNRYKNQINMSKYK